MPVTTIDDRYIPVGVRRQLRREVNYGCPVYGCGNPLLTYHHFDPPYIECASFGVNPHNPNGMIALCMEHHGQCDIKRTNHGWLSKEELRALKKSPFLSDMVVGKINTLPPQILVVAGSVASVQERILLSVSDVPTMRLRNAGGRLALDAFLMAEDGQEIAVVDAGDVLVKTQHVQDMEFLPRSISLTIDAGNYGLLKVRFSRLSTNDLAEYFTSEWSADWNLWRTILGTIHVREAPRVPTTEERANLADYGRIFADRVVAMFYTKPDHIPMVELTAHVRVVDTRGTPGLLLFRPWGIDVGFLPGVNEFCAWGSTLLPAGPNRIAKFFRFNPIAYVTAGKSHGLVSFNVSDGDGEAGGAAPFDSFWEDAWSAAGRKRVIAGDEQGALKAFGYAEQLGQDILLHG
jgi:hypothetical protein